MEILAVVNISLVPFFSWLTIIRGRVGSRVWFVLIHSEPELLIKSNKMLQKQGYLIMEGQCYKEKKVVILSILSYINTLLRSYVGENTYKYNILATNHIFFIIFYNTNAQ